MPPPDPDWPLRQSTWTVSQIAAELGCADRTVRRWCDDGELVSHRTAGGHYRVRGTDLFAFCNGPAEDLGGPIDRLRTPTSSTCAA